MEYHMDMYEKMKSGSIEEGKAVVRLKTGMDRKDPALRDHIIMRISDAPHPRIGTKVRLWPVLEWSWGLDDPMLGITHIVRGMDLDKEGQIEEIIWDFYGWKHANITLYGRLKFEDEFKLSKTLARRNIQLGVYDGWNDPRTWSLQSLAARGIHPDALRESLCDLGLSKRGIEFDKAWLYAKNTKIIDSSADRYWFVEKPHLLKVKDIPLTQFIAQPLFHPNFPDRGTRHLKVPISRGTCSVYIAEADLHEVLSPKGKIIHPALSEGQVVRLKDMFNVKIEKLGDPIQATFDSLEMVQDSRKIQVVPKTTSIPLRVLQPDGKTTEGYGESNLHSLKSGTIVQFERYGYVRLISISDEQIYGYFTNN